MNINLTSEQIHDIYKTEHWCSCNHGDYTYVYLNGIFIYKKPTNAKYNATFDVCKIIELKINRERRK